jgi:hypothetical protein
MPLVLACSSVLVQAAASDRPRAVLVVMAAHVAARSADCAVGICCHSVTKSVCQGAVTLHRVIVLSNTLIHRARGSPAQSTARTAALRHARTGLRACFHTRKEGCRVGFGDVGAPRACTASNRVYAHTHTKQSQRHVKQVHLVTE